MFFWNPLVQVIFLMLQAFFWKGKGFHFLKANHNFLEIGQLFTFSTQAIFEHQKINVPQI